VTCAAAAASNRRATSQISWSPTWWPRVSLTTLNPFQVDDHHRDAEDEVVARETGAGGKGSELGPVRQSGQGIVQRVVPQPADQHLVCTAPPEACVATVLEQPHVRCRRSRGNLTHAVVHGQDPDDFSSTRSAATTASCASRHSKERDSGRAPAVTRTALSVETSWRSSTCSSRFRRAGGRVSCFAVEPPDVAGRLAGEPEDLGDLRAQQLAGLLEHSRKHVRVARRFVELRD